MRADEFVLRRHWQVRERLGHDAWVAAGVAVAYVAAAHAGFRLAFVAEQITTVWAPTGIALATLLFYGRRFWPAIWLGAFAANATTTAPIWTAVVIATGNTLEAFVAVWALQRTPTFSHALRRVSDVVALVFVAALGCTTISATIGVTVLCAAGVQVWERFVPLWWNWWFGDALGAIIVAPAILATVQRAWSRRTAAQALLFVGGALLVTYVAFGLFPASPHPLEYIVFPLVIAAAVVGGPAVTSLVVLSASGLAIWQTIRGFGPFAGRDTYDSLILLQVFMGVLAVTSLLLAAAVAERRSSEEREREAAAGLRRREEMLKLSQRAGGVATFEWDPLRQQAYGSAEFFRMFGLPARDGLMTAAEWGEFVHPDDRAAMAAHLAHALEGAEPASADYRIVAANGLTRWLTYSGQLLSTPDGDRMLGIVVDITDRKRLETELRRHADDAQARQQQLEEANRELARRVLEQQTLLDVLPIGIGIATDRECREIRINRAFAETLGLSPATNASKTAPASERPTNFRVYTPDGVEVPDADLPMQVAARRGQEVREVELDVVHEDGRVVRLLEYAAPLLDEYGEPRGAIGAFVDVTAAHHARATLRRSEERLRQEVDVRTTLAQVGASLAGELRSAKLIQAVTDRSTTLTEAEFGAFFYNVTDANGDSSSLYSLSGAPREKFSGFPHPRATQVFGPTFRGEGILRLDDVTRDPRYGRNAPIYGLPPGHLPVRSYLAVPVIGRGGVVLGGLFFGHSQPSVFTERHELLASGVAQWAAIALDNARLYQDAEDANRLKDEFLATLSHELRTPLNAVLGWAHMLREGTMQPAMYQRALESLERNARAQAQLVEDLLDVSRIIAGKLQIKGDAVDLGAVVTHAVDTVRAGVTAKRLTLQVHVPTGERLVVTGDADRLQQVVWNLVSNAVKFTPTGGRVDVELRQIDAKAEFVVRDTGQGIDPSFRPHLFQRFRQMDASKTRVHGGLGLGLSIVRHLVEAHGGTVEAESEGLGRGATFRVILPLRAVEESDADRTAAGTAATDRPLTGVRVLVVDDEEDARELARYVLESRGAVVMTTASAGEALHLLAHDRFDLLLADLGMAEQDGLALIRAIRGLPAHSINRDIPAIALTAYTGRREREEAFGAGFALHLGKPVDPDQLIAAVLTTAAPTDPRD
jgi:PAS domain S-box-containing protein